MRFRLWHSANTRSLRCLWAFEELGLKRGIDYGLVTMPFPPRVHDKRYLETNPLGTVPWFEHRETGDAAPRSSMSESCAVPQYLAAILGSDMAVAATEPDYGTYLNWICHADATLTFPQAVVMRYRLFEPGRAETAADDYAKWYVARLRLLTAALDDGRDFLVGGRFTMADVCVGYALFNASEHGLYGEFSAAQGNDPAFFSDRYKPHVSAYLERLMERPAWTAAQEQQATTDDPDTWA